MDLLLFIVILTWLCVGGEDVSVKIKNLIEDDHFYVTNADEKGCSDMVITSHRGIITSPSYPNIYPNHVSCSWHIRGEFGEVITLRFDDFDIEESGACEETPCCTFNWLKVGPNFNGTEKRYCGQKELKPPVFVSKINKVWIKFHVSNVINGGRGFKLYFSIGPRLEKCLTHQFKCDTGECIEKSNVCNGYNDCDDGSDESSCTNMCTSGRLCQSVLYCYDFSKHCDGVIDCPDYSDEMNCGYCISNQTRCGSRSSQCYDPWTQRCNRVMDCNNGEDEKNCLIDCPGKIKCTSGTGCFAVEERCNGVAQCSDSSDEKDCDAELCNYDHGGFLCENSHCIRELWKCDRTNDCGDGSDEHNCLRNSILTAAVMGSLICALLLIIAISCTCRLYALRALENRMSTRETPLMRFSREIFLREPPPTYAVAVGDNPNLYVENNHYPNMCSRTGQRRSRRSRRHRERRQVPVPVLDGFYNPVNFAPPPNYSVMPPSYSVPPPGYSVMPPSYLVTDSSSQFSCDISSSISSPQSTLSSSLSTNDSGSTNNPAGSEAQNNEHINKKNEHINEKDSQDALNPVINDKYFELTQQLNSAEHTMCIESYAGKCKSNAASKPDEKIDSERQLSPHSSYLESNNDNRNYICKNNNDNSEIPSTSQSVESTNTDILTTYTEAQESDSAFDTSCDSDTHPLIV